MKTKQHNTKTKRPGRPITLDWNRIGLSGEVALEVAIDTSMEGLLSDINKKNEIGEFAKEAYSSLAEIVRQLRRQRPNMFDENIEVKARRIK
jgi:hypothetical protein